MTLASKNSDCEQALRAVDPYSGGDLSPAAEPVWRQHVESCEQCRRELENRRQLRARLKVAVEGVAVPFGLETRIQAQVRAAQRPLWYSRMAAAGLAAALCVGVGIAYQLGHLRLTEASQESYIASISQHVAGLMQVGLRDHLHCAVFGKFPKQAPPLEEVTAELGPEYRPIVPAVRQHLPENVKVVSAHQCRYKTRRFVHVVLRANSGLISLVVANKEDGETFASPDFLPALTQSGIPVYQAGAQQYQIASFEAGSRLVYLVSDLPQQTNTQLLAAMAPALREALRKMEG